MCLKAILIDERKEAGFFNRLFYSETVLTAAEVKAIATDNPLLLEKMTLDNEVDRLKLIKNRWSNEKATMEKNLSIIYPNRIKKCEEQIRNIQADLSLSSQNNTDGLCIELKGITFVDEKEANESLKSIINSESSLGEEELTIGKYRGLDVFIRKNAFNESCIGLKGKSQFEARVGDRLNIHKLEKIIDEYAFKTEELKKNIVQVQSQIKIVELELKKPFRYENELRELVKKQTELNLKMEFKEELEAENANQISDEPSLKTSRNHRSNSKGLDLDY